METGTSVSNISLILVDNVELDRLYAAKSSQEVCSTRKHLKIETFVFDFVYFLIFF